MLPYATSHTIVRNNISQNHKVLKAQDDFITYACPSPLHFCSTSHFSSSFLAASHTLKLQYIQPAHRKWRECMAMMRIAGHCWHWAHNICSLQAKQLYWIARPHRFGSWQVHDVTFNLTLWQTDCVECTHKYFYWIFFLFRLFVFFFYLIHLVHVLKLFFSGFLRKIYLFLLILFYIFFSYTFFIYSMSHNSSLLLGN